MKRALDHTITVSMNFSIDDLVAYAAFLCEYLAREETGEPSDSLRHGQYLAMRVLHDALAAVGTSGREVRHG